MIGKWDGFTVGPWGIAGRVVGLLRHGAPQAQVFEYAADDSSVVDDGTAGEVKNAISIF